MGDDALSRSATDAEESTSVDTPRSKFKYDEWYQKNKASLNETRRLKYQNDAAFREVVLSRNAKSRSDRRALTAEQRKEKFLAKKAGARIGFRAEVVEGVKMFTIGALAKTFGVSIKTLRVWEKKGLVPEPDLRSEGGDRLYSLDFVEKLTDNLTKQGYLPVSKSSTRKQWVDVDVLYADDSVRAERMYRIGTLAKAVSRTVVSLEVLERKGLLPETPFRVSKIGQRVYTLEMIETLKQAFEMFCGSIRGSEWASFTKFVLDGWTALGVFQASIVDVGGVDERKRTSGDLSRSVGDCDAEEIRNASPDEAGE